MFEKMLLDSEKEQILNSTGRIPICILEKLSKDPDTYTRKDLLNRKDLPKKILSILSDDEHPYIKSLVLSHQNTSKKTIQKILKKYIMAEKLNKDQIFRAYIEAVIKENEKICEIYLKMKFPQKL